MSALQAGDEVRVYAQRMHSAIAVAELGYPGEVLKVGRVKATIRWSFPERSFGATTTQTRTAVFRMDTGYIDDRTRLWFIRTGTGGAA